MASADLERVEPQNLRRKSTAAIEWRTIPPTIKVRHKKRPPPITIHSKRSFEQLIWTPGSHSNSATTASSATTIFTPLTSSAPSSTFFREFSKIAVVGQEPRTPYYATPGFQQSPNGPDEIKVPVWPLPINKFIPQVGKTTLEVVTEIEYAPFENHDPDFREAPSPPLSPSVYLTLNPWTLPEYLLLLSIKPLCGIDDDINWDEIASKLNASTRHQPRSSWDCWHRWTVPWCRRPPKQHPSKPRPNTYPHAPGVQHEYNLADLQGLIELWTLLSSTIGVSQQHSTTLEFPEPEITAVAVQPRRAWGRAHHPAYPPQSAPPNVPKRTLGDAHERGLAPWFTTSAVNTPVLQRILESQPERSDDWLPVHLRGRAIPPPHRPMAATPDTG